VQKKKKVIYLKSVDINIKGAKCDCQFMKQIQKKKIKDAN